MSSGKMSSSAYKPVTSHPQAGEDGSQAMKAVTYAEVNTRCGFWGCKPDFLQPCAKIGAFTGFYSLAALITSTLNSYVNSQVTTLERQFGFTSHQTGIIMAANDIGYLVCVLFVGYMASRSHIPRSLGVATITFGLSGITCSLPHFLFGSTANEGDLVNGSSPWTGTGRPSSVSARLCDVYNVSGSGCQTASGSKFGLSETIHNEKIAQISFAIIVIGMAIQGFAKAPRVSFVVTFIDDNTAKENTGCYISITTAVGVLGPACAYFMGGQFSRMYVTLKATSLTPEDRRWIGAWWLGYVLFGCLALIISVPLFCFPRSLARTRSHRPETDGHLLDTRDGAKTQAQRQEQLSRDTRNESSPGKKQFSAGRKSFCRCPGIKFFLRHSRDFLASLYRLASNPVYVLIVISGCCTIFAVAGGVSFTPKYMERVFDLPAYKANYIIAGQVLGTSWCGALIGGYVTKRMKMTAMKGLKFVIVVTAIGFVFHLMGFLLKCDQPTVHNWPREETTCNSECHCRDNSYFPICGGDGRTYYSPCHAGCLQAEHEVYHNCTCIPGGVARAGTCSYGCSHVYGYPIVMGIRKLVAFISVIPNIIIIIRCVSRQDRSMALAVSTFVKALLGWLLAPIIFGSMIDSICVIWDVKCGVKGRCLLYDNDLFRIKLHGYGAVAFTLSSLFLLLAFLYAWYTKCLDDEGNDKDDVGVGGGGGGGSAGGDGGEGDNTDAKDAAIEANNKSGGDESSVPNGQPVTGRARGLKLNAVV